MKIELSYKYSQLDKEPQFGLMCEAESIWDEAYIRWIYFYLGEFFGGKRPRIYPFTINEGRILKNYKMCNDAKRQARLIFNKINKTLEK
jgi:hypothetical protein